MPDDQQALIDFLSTPQAYGLEAGARIERIDTHAAAVFLVGDRVYKLKRAVKFPFLDFSTCALRRRYCADEVRLNRRTAPDLYLGVAPVRRGEAGFTLGRTSEPDLATGEAEDWLVVMRRFDQRNLLSSCAERGALTPDLVADLAREIARFHAEARPEADHWGGAVLVHTVEMDVGQMKARGELLDTGLSEELAALMPAEAMRQADLADRRRAMGAVKRCHGDLHLKNIYLEAGKPQAFDGIEFNDRLSCIDVLYDLSFLLMDLDFRDLKAHANLALNTYLWHSPESDEELMRALALLPIYLARRGAIRAHVDAAGIPHIADKAAARQLRERACAYQRYARSLFPSPKPSLLAIGGLSGTGKTTLAKRLAPEQAPTPGAILLRSDVLRKRMAGIPLDQRMPPGSYAPEKAAAVYDELHRLAAIALKAGRSVILDAVYSKPQERDAARRVAEQAGVSFTGLWLDAPPELLRRRVDARTGDASDATTAVVERQAEYDVGQIDWARLDASVGIDQLTKCAQALLNRTDQAVPG